MAIFWYLVYALALFLIFVTGILAGSRDPKKAPARKPIRSNCGFGY